MGWTKGGSALALALVFALGASAQAQDADADGLRDQHEPGDSDGDQIADVSDPDDDNDGIATILESADANGDGNPGDALDTDGDLIPNYLDADDDGDEVLTMDECEVGPQVDLDEDGTPDYLDADSDGSNAELPLPDADADGDGLTNEQEDPDGDRVYGEHDSDRDRIPDYLDEDDDGDGLKTRFERGAPTAPIDTDGDLVPNYRDPDDDGDSVPTIREQADPNGDGDPEDAVSTAVAMADYLATDDDEDGIPTRDERPGDVDRDSDADGVPDYRDEDDDQDGLVAEGSSDLDGDAKPNYLDPDDDGDGVPSVRERVPTIDTDGDGTPDPYDSDDDGDSLSTASELGSNPASPSDSDGDGVADYLDADDDGDGVATLDELPASRDSDGDGTVDRLDPDDDGDGIPTRSERALEVDVDVDGTPNWLDLDSDGNGVSDATEGTGDSDGDGIPDFLDRPSAPSVSDGGSGPSGDAGSDAGVGPLPSDAGGIVLRPVGSDEGCSAAPGARRSSPALSSLLFLLLVCGSARRLRARVAASALLALPMAGCGDEAPETLFPLEGGNGLLDANLDAAIQDGASEAGRSDSAALHSECAIEGEVLSLPIVESERGWAALQHADAIHLAYAQATCTGGGAATGTRIDYLSVGSTGAFGAPKTLAADSQGACRIRRSPALAVGTSGALELYFTSNVTGSHELYRQDVAQARPPERLTEDPVTAIDSELYTVAMPLGESPLLAYVNEGAPGSANQLITRRPGLPESEIVALALNQPVSALELTPWPSATIGGVLGWMSDRSAGAAIVLQPLTQAGTPSGSALELSTQAGALSQVAIAATEARAATVYTTQLGSAAELRFRELDREGRPSASERRLTSTNRSVSNPALAPYSDGYVISFREVPAASSVSASLRLLFVSEEGNVGGERRLSDAARSGSASRVFVMNDGRLVVIWGDHATTGTVLHALRARCL